MRYSGYGLSSPVCTLTVFVSTCRHHRPGASVPVWSISLHFVIVNMQKVVDAAADSCCSFGNQRSLVHDFCLGSVDLFGNQTSTLHGVFGRSPLLYRFAAIIDQVPVCPSGRLLLTSCSEHASGSRCDCRFMLCLVSPLVTQLRGPGAPLLIALPHDFIILQLLASGFIFGQWSHAAFVILLVGYSGHFDKFCNSRRNRLAGVFSIHASANPA